MRLTSRERWTVAAGTAALAALAGYVWGLKPAMDRRATLLRVIPQRESQLEALRRIGLECDSLKRHQTEARRRIAAQGEGFGLLSFLENIERSQGLASNVAHMKRSTVPLGADYNETRVEVRLESVSLDQVTRFLVEIQNADAAVGLRALNIRQSARQPGALDATIQVASVAPSRP